MLVIYHLAEHDELRSEELVHGEDVEKANDVEEQREHEEDAARLVQVEQRAMLLV